eukprot:TRINITY_DN14411_c0_g1_i1.p1 TRINITY_DN14411_c0_g1~~TRINITY_DN14411_c0_g1_i1.p1  ORF type:complete len:200 (+),score=19.67 TRINITY_DN14411_c0_g1_i1:49-648(+)
MSTGEQNVLPADVVGEIARFLTWKESNRLCICTSWITKKFILKHLTTAKIFCADEFNTEAQIQCLASNVGHLAGLTNLSVEKFALGDSESDLVPLKELFKAVGPQVQRFTINAWIPDPLPRVQILPHFTFNREIMREIKIDEVVSTQEALELMSDHWPSLAALLLDPGVSAQLLFPISRLCNNLHPLQFSLSCVTECHL